MGLKNSIRELFYEKKKCLYYHIFLLDSIIMSQEIMLTLFSLIASWLDRGQGS